MNRPTLSAAAILLLTALTSTTACVFADGVRFKDTMGVCQARVLHVPPPAGQYEEIGFVTVTGGAAATVETTRAALQQKACELGADAVYVADPGYGTCNAWEFIAFGDELCGQFPHPKGGEFAYVDIDGVLLRSVDASPPAAAVAPPTPLEG